MPRRVPVTVRHDGGSRELWANRDFNIFWFGQTLSELGNAVALVALPLLVLRATGSVVQMGLLTAISSVGSICTGLFAGSLVDRLDRRRLMIVCDLARVVLYGVIPVCWAVSPQVWLLYVVMALTSIFTMTFDVSYVTAVSNLVDGDRIVSANGRLQTTNAIAYIAGPMLAGLLSGSFGPTAAIALNAVTFAVSAAALGVIRLRTPVPVAGTERHNLKEGFLVGFVFLWRTPVLRALTVLLTIIMFLGLGMADIVIFYVRNGLGHSEQVLGAVLGIAEAGTVLAAVLTPLLRRSLGFGICWLGSYVICGSAVLLLGASTSLAAVPVLMLGYTFGMGVAGICSMSLRQVMTPDHLLGRVTAAFWTVHNALAPLGAAVLTALVGRFGVRAPLVGVGVVFLVVVAVGLFTPIRQRHPERVNQSIG